MLSNVWEGDGGVNKCYGRTIFVFFIKENLICAMIRHHAEPNNLQGIFLLTLTSGSEAIF